MHSFESAEIEMVLAMRISRLWSIPRRSESLYAETLTKLICELVANRDLTTFKKYVEFTAMILLRPQRGGRGKDGRRSAIVNERLKLFGQNKLDLLWSHVVAQLEDTKKRMRKKEGTKQREPTISELAMSNRRRAIRYIRAGELSKGASALDSQGMAPLDVVGDQLRSKHPVQAEPDVDYDGFTDVEPDLLDVDTVHDVMKGMRKMAGGGP